MNQLSNFFSDKELALIARYEELLNLTNDDDQEYTPELKDLYDERIELYYQLPKMYCIDCHGICNGGH